MDLQTRKIVFIQEFLNLQNEEIISQFENLLRKKTSTTLEKQDTIEPLSIEELNTRIDKSEDDFKNGKFKTSKQLLEKYR